MLTKIGTKLNKNKKYRDQNWIYNIDFDTWHTTGLTRGHLKKFKKNSKIQKFKNSKKTTKWHVTLFMVI